RALRRSQTSAGAGSGNRPTRRAPRARRRSQTPARDGSDNRSIPSTPLTPSSRNTSGRAPTPAGAASDSTDRSPPPQPTWTTSALSLRPLRVQLRPARVEPVDLLVSVLERLAARG